MSQFHVPRLTARRLCAALLVVAATATSALAADAAWKLQKDKDGIQVSTRPVAGWQIHEVRGQVSIEARLSSLVAVITDETATPELTDLVEHSEVQNRESDTRYQIYARMKMPWPVSNRDIVNQREVVQDPQTLAVTITDAATSTGQPPNKDYVRIVKSTQRWILTPQADGSVQVESYILSDPAGPIPSSIINAMSVSTPFRTLTKLRELVKRPKYADAKLSYITEKSGA